jgi:nitrite transporter NirC
MYKSSVEAFANLAKEKSNLLRNNFFGYFVSSMLAGIYVGFGIVLIFAIGSPLFSNNSPFLKFIMGISFGIALTLVIFAGSELYTGNTEVLVLATGSYPFIPPVKGLDLPNIFAMRTLTDSETLGENKPG